MILSLNPKYLFSLPHGYTAECIQSGVAVKKICCSKRAAFVYMPHWSSANMYYLYYHDNTSPYGF